MLHHARQITEKPRKIYIFLCWLGILTLAAETGCTQKQKAVDFYVDAVMYKETNQNKRAIAKLKSSVKIDKRFSPAYSLMGEIHQNMKQYPQSAEAYEQATLLNPWSFKDFFRLGRVYQIMKDFANAVQAYVKACEIKPGHFRAHLGAAQNYYKLRDYPNATTYAHKAEEIDPDIAEVKKLLGDIYNAQKDFEQAIMMYKRSLETDANDPNVITALGIAYVNTNRYEPARELLGEVVQTQPENLKAWRFLGFTDLQLNNIEQAIESYSGALAIDENDWQALNGLGVAYMMTALEKTDNEFRDKAVLQWKRSLELKPNQQYREKLTDMIRKYSKE